MDQIVLLNNKRTESSDNYVKMLTCLSLRAPEGCVAISLEKTRLLRFTRNDNSYRWIREKGFTPHHQDFRDIPKGNATKSRCGAGFTLVEVLIALVVSLLVFLALMQTALVGIDSNMRNILRDEAVSIAEMRMNEARNIPFTSLVSDAASPLSDYDSSCNSGCNDCPTGFSTGKCRCRDVKNISDFKFCTNLTCADFGTDTSCASDDSDNRKIDIMVGWKWKGENYTHSITTIVRRP